MKLNPARGEAGELGFDIRNALVVEKNLSRFVICSVDGYVERRKSVVEDSLDVPFFNVRKRRKISVGE